MKHLICYDTTNGQILQSQSKSHESIVRMSGTGELVHRLINDTKKAVIISNDLITLDLATVVCFKVTKALRAISSVWFTRLSSTEVDIGRAFPESMEGLVTLIAEGFTEVLSYTEEEKALTIASVKISVNHDNVSALKITSDQDITSTSWFVDIADNTLKHKSVISIIPD